MTNIEFRKVLEERIGKIRMVLDRKAGEYARGNDRLHNFKRVAQIKRITQEEACIDGFCKHLVSILDMVDDRKGPNPQYSPMDMWEEKIGDAINYLILLEAIVKEGNGQEMESPIYIVDKNGMEGL